MIPESEQICHKNPRTNPNTPTLVFTDCLAFDFTSSIILPDLPIVSSVNVSGVGSVVSVYCG
jgi:hypothetical protein